MTEPLTVIIYDNTTLADGWDGPKEDGLALSWKWGSELYSRFNKSYLSLSAYNWTGALTALTQLGAERGIAEIHFWGHGSPGAAYIGRDKLDIFDLLGGKKEEEAELLLQVKDLLTFDALVWFRTCSTFAGEKGQQFAVELSDMLECRVAGFTHIIGPWQSGLHTLSYGEVPSWSVEEGIKKGTPSNIKKTKISIPFITPNGISCLSNEIPEGW